MDDLNQIATEAMGSTETESTSTESTSTETTSTPTAVAPKTAPTAATVEKPVTQNTVKPQVQNQQSQQQKLSRRQIEAKNNADLRAAQDRQITEMKKQLIDYQRQMEPLKPFMSEIQKALELKKQEELKAQYAQNPLSVNQQMIQEQIQQAIQPFQQQAAEAQLQQDATQRIDYIKQIAGSEEMYKETSPFMKQILDNTIRENPVAAAQLAQYPEFLFRVARDVMNEQKQMQSQQQQVQNQESKAQVAKFNGGVSKPNRNVRIPTVQGKEAVRENAFNFLRELTGQNK